MNELGSAALGSGVSGLLGLAGSAINYGFQKKLAAQQNQYNIDMWKMQAEYNSPQAQMQRFQDAGLNPNLIYGQGSNGNMSQAPQMVTPEAPEFSKELQRIGEAFNIENLRTLIANRKKAQADARNAETNADRNALDLFAEKSVGRHYYFDLNKGQYVERPEDGPYEVTVIHPSAYYANKKIADIYSRTHLVPIRGQLLGAQRAYLNPQIQMANYEAKYMPVSYWVGTAGKGIKAISDITGMFNPSRYLMPISNQARGYLSPSGKVYHY